MTHYANPAPVQIDYFGARQANTTALAFPHRLQDTIDTVRALLQNVRKLALVGDRLGADNFWKEFANELPSVAAQIAIIDLMGLSMTELRRRVATLPEDAAIAYVGIYKDGAG